MIHYHGTPIGGVDAAIFLQGRHGLVSFFYQGDLGIVMDVCKSFVLDNGAFSHWSKGKGEIDFNEYKNWVMGIYRHPGYEWCLIPDKIDGDEEHNKGLVDKWADEAPGLSGVPVWHLHESLEYLDYLVTNFPRIALGSSGAWSSPGTESWWFRIAEAMDIICDDHGRPKTKLHGLRMLDPEVFQYLPLSSADSTNAVVNGGSKGRFGMYKPPSKGQRASVIAERIEAHNSAPVWCGIKQGRLAL